MLQPKLHELLYLIRNVNRLFMVGEMEAADY